MAVPVSHVKISYSGSQNPSVVRVKSEQNGVGLGGFGSQANLSPDRSTNNGREIQTFARLPWWAAPQNLTSIVANGVSGSLGKARRPLVFGVCKLSSVLVANPSNRQQ